MALALRCTKRLIGVLDFTSPVNALSLTTPTVSRDFIHIFSAYEYTFPGARQSRLCVCLVSLVSPPTSSGRFRFIDPVLPTKHLFGHARPGCVMRTPRREAGRLINQTVTLRTITPSRHSRTGTTASLLHLSTTTELVVINLVPQHDPQPNPQFSCCGDSRFPHTLLH